MAQSRPQITCHVLDTAAGKPAAGILVMLQLTKSLGVDNSILRSPGISYTGLTNADGRVQAWDRGSTLMDLAEVFSNLAANAEVPAQEAGVRGLRPREHEWLLTFAVADYFGAADCFWTDIEIKFKTLVPLGADPAQLHWHVPLLLSPFSYSTYRGS